MTRLLVCGDRNWTDRELIAETLADIAGFMDISLVIEGGARGADRMAREVALTMMIPVQEWPAAWKTHGKAAGTVRNQMMLDKGQPALVLAFHDDLRGSKGTKHMVRIAQEAGLPTRVVGH